MTHEQIRHMVNRFLSWELPATFSPDGGVSFQRIGEQPIGTNVFTAVEAEAMVRHMLEGMPDGPRAGDRERNRLRDVLDRAHAALHDALNATPLDSPEGTTSGFEYELRRRILGGR